MKSRVALAVIGIILIGAAGGIAGILSTPHPYVQSVVLALPTATATSTTTAATATTTATTPTDDPTPTDMPPPNTPTSTRPVPTATPNSAFNHTGRISNVNATAQTFTLTISSGAYTIHWDSAGQCSGLTTDCSQLSTYATSAYRASVAGTLQSSNAVEASTIKVIHANT